MSQERPKELHPIESSELHARRERAFLVIAGLFLGSLAMLNILGTSRFLVLASFDSQLGGLRLGEWAGPNGINFALAVGVLPYPVTFLCTDLISEFYGRRRANWVVFVGLMINVWVIFILWVGGIMPSVPELNPLTGLPFTGPIEPAEAGGPIDPEAFAFYRIRAIAFGAVVASMVAYLAAQLCDVYLFHFWKRLTNGRHLWLRNNGSTLISQLVDTTAVITITHFYARALPIDPDKSVGWQLLLFIATGYVFKLVVALADTIPFYLGVAFLTKYLRFDPVARRNL